MSITYRKLTKAEFEKAMEIRIKVFVEEQNVPPEEEHDSYDAEADHFGVFLNNQLIGTGRLVQEESLGKIGRIAILPEFRGQGLGRGLIETIIEAGKQRGLREFILGAQLQAIGFYGRLGFVPEGEEYMDGGIPHRLMRLTL